jgi:hypothetical protein
MRKIVGKEQQRDLEADQMNMDFLSISSWAEFQIEHLGIAVKLFYE